MPLPLAPVAAVALRYGTVALAAYALSRSVHTAAVRQADEDALDTVAEGLGVARPQGRSQVNAEARWRRTVRLGEDGPGLEVDLSALGRIRIRKVAAC